jgi:hypothetical protein
MNEKDSFMKYAALHFVGERGGGCNMSEEIQ